MSDSATGDILAGGSIGAVGGPVGLGIGAGAGLLKYLLFDKPANERQRQLAAQTQAYSPWTGLKGDTPGQLNMGNSILSGAATGGALAQNMQNSANGQKLQDSQIANQKAQTEYLNRLSPQTTGYMQTSPGQDALGSYTPAGNMPYNSWQQDQLQKALLARQSGGPVSMGNGD